ncbi:MAG: DUF2169 domain-containing protein [Desulfatitalea sp.]
MRLEKATDMQAGYTMGLDKEGREHLVVCVKGTYSIPRDGSMPRLADEQLPLVEADTFTGEPGFSAPIHESDYAPVKPRCDVLLNGSAYAPGGRPAVKVPVGLRFGTMQKGFNVVGDRVWEYSFLMTKASWAQPFVRMPISYDRAFGGVDDSQGDPRKVRAILENPVGVGYHHYIGKEWVDGRPLPNTEAPGEAVAAPDQRYRPISFGPVGRGWQPRATLAGTYDQNWLDNIFPFLPPDFDPAYFQAAPVDQQVAYPQGGEPVILNNLTPEGRIGFPFPRINVLVWFFLKNGEEKEAKAVVDTVMLQPDENCFTVTARASVPLRRNMLEMELVVVGHDPQDKHKAWPATDAAFPLTADAAEEASGVQAAEGRGDD